MYKYRLTKHQQLAVVPTMNDFSFNIEKISNFIEAGGHTLKDGTKVFTATQYVKHIDKFTNSYSKATIDNLIKIADNKSKVSIEYKELSIIYAICFMYPLEVIEAIDKLKV